jgi:Cu-Zn family superoxide dismutase
MTCRSLHAVGFAALLATTAALFPHHAAAQAAGDGAKAHTAIKDAQGKRIGDATLTQMAHGVVIIAELSGLPPGPHGMHIHAIGKCDPPAFTSAGGHFNPTGHKHGYNAEAGPHVGDLPNLIVASDGKATVDIWVADLSLGGGQVASGTSAPDKPAAGGAQPASSGAHNVFDQGGASLVIHAKVDDYASDPAGNSGDRIACGVIER